MVKYRRSNSRKNRNKKATRTNRVKAGRINASTPFETCSEQLSPFGGLLALIKFLDLINFRQIFDFAYIAPTRKPKLGHCSMMIGLLMLLFIGFDRIWHFTYVRMDAIICGFFRLSCLPVASTFWRYVDSMGINQGKSLITVMNILRERVWQQLGLNYIKINVDIDTTVKTIYGNQQGGRKGHNNKYRGKKGYRPILCFIQQTREYLLGKLRVGETINAKECAAFITQIKECLPGCVQQVLLRADGEFLSRHSVEAALAVGFNFIIANKGCEPYFDPDSWYRPYKRKDVEYNSCLYQPRGWQLPCRFVVMRVPKKAANDKPIQLKLFDVDRYTYRIFCTNLGGKAHQIIDQYDKRADVENLVGEAKREGLNAIPSAKFKNNYAFFQVVMLAYNIRRYLKLMAAPDNSQKHEQKGSDSIASNTIRIARLKLLYIAAKVVKDQNRDKVKYSIHDVRTPIMIKFLEKPDKWRSLPRPWLQDGGWPQIFAFD
jgi:hypothetical protein